MCQKPPEVLKTLLIGFIFCIVVLLLICFECKRVDEQTEITLQEVRQKGAEQ